MNALLYGILVAALLFIIDIPWLLLNSGTFDKVVTNIQGSPLRFRYEAILVVYPALAYLLTRARSQIEAGLIGLTTYAVYDFTTYSALKDYPIGVATMDALWGGTLFSITYWVLQKLT